jgi:hypothetical protein
VNRIRPIAFALLVNIVIVVGLSQLAACSSVPKEQPSALTGELGILSRPDGRVSTELSVTVTDPRLNKARPTNIPLLVKGQVNVEKLLRDEHPSPSRQQVEIAIKRAVERVAEGADLPSYDSIEAAVSAAKARSESGGSIEHFKRLGQEESKPSP